MTTMMTKTRSRRTPIIPWSARVVPTIVVSSQTSPRPQSSVPDEEHYRRHITTRRGRRTRPRSTHDDCAHQMQEPRGRRQANGAARPRVVLPTRAVPPGAPRPSDASTTTPPWKSWRTRATLGHFPRGSSRTPRRVDTNLLRRQR